MFKGFWGGIVLVGEVMGGLGEDVGLVDGPLKGLFGNATGNVL